MATQRRAYDPVIGQRNRGRSGGMSSQFKFQNGHLPSGLFSVPKTHVTTGINYEGESDMDTGSESDEGGRYSLETSPQDDKIPNGRRKGHANGPSRPRSIFSDGELSDSTMSSEANSSLRFGAHRYGTNVQTNGGSDKKAFNTSIFDDDIPSAPPFVGSFDEHDRVKNSEADVTSISGTSRGSATTGEPITCSSTSQDATQSRMPNTSGRTAAVSHNHLFSQYPTFHASGRGTWHTFVSYEACVRLCLHSWAKGCVEAPVFLENECALLRNSFSLKQALLQPEEDLLRKMSSELVSEGATVKPKKTFGKMKVQVRKVKMGLEPPTGCSFSSIKPSKEKIDSLRFQISNIKSTVSSEWEAIRKIRVAPRLPINATFSQKSLVYLHSGTRYMKDVSGIIKLGFTTFRSSSKSYEVVPEIYSCSLRVKSLPEDDAVKMQAGSTESHIFLPDGIGDDLIIEVHDSKGVYCGRAIAQVADISDDQGEKLRWWPIYHEPEHDLVGRVQLYINYSTSADENRDTKCGTVAETIAYDCVLEAAMKVQQFQQRNLLLHGSWKWLVYEFASYYGVSEAYTKLRYLSYIMDVATPTSDCLDLVHDLILPVVLKGRTKNSLSHQENRMLGEVSEKVEEIIALAFENYKSLDESLPTGIIDIFRRATGLVPPALASALKLYILLHDILSPEAQLKLCRYFQTAAKKRSKHHLTETDEFVSINNEKMMDPVANSTAYQKMVSLCQNIRNEILTDLEIHSKDVLPSFLDLPNLSSAIYSAELCNRLRAFLVACPPTGPSSPVAGLVIATADFQKDLISWNISHVKGGVDAKELFNLYIIRWIHDKRLALLDLCKPDKIKWSGMDARLSTTPFIDEIYDLLKETLGEYDVIISRWPEYIFPLESAIADVEKAVMETLDKHYADVLSPLKENGMPLKIGLKYVQKMTKGTVCPFTVSNELGILLNSMKRMLDILRPQIEAQFKSWGSCLPDGSNMVPGERISEITIMLRTKFRGYMQALMDKLVENTKLQSPTKLKKIIQDAKEGIVESDLRNRMQPLKDMLENIIDQLHAVFETQVFIIICRGFWDRMGQDVLKFLEDRKDSRSWYKASRVAISILEDIFASHMQKLLGNALQERDLEPPRSILEVRSMLCKDAVNDKDSNFFY
ncbi:PREDICTED: uncharacterized protein LOC109172616 [Ipomoea nil]|uniref:uncharacterized protein LOC109172616 n=1 Tax=Ipomoea nil TaxID=35883 RepID=UPI000901D7BC|nr:PREDICTED: uncharacterized protein LOC109172616 [Ipomoea nil]XP_019177355.1 PREDICTED: uncharacterized protein LOC109172616 [Ipomoea nil]